MPVIWLWLKWKRMPKILSSGLADPTTKVLKWREVLLIGWQPWQTYAFTKKIGSLILAKKLKQAVKRKRSLSFWTCQNLCSSGTMKTCKFASLILYQMAKINVFWEIWEHMILRCKSLEKKHFATPKTRMPIWKWSRRRTASWSCS